MKFNLLLNLFIIYTKAKMNDTNPLGTPVLKIWAISIFSGVPTLTLRFKDLNPEIVVEYVLWGGSQAYEDGCAPRAILESTRIRALDYINLTIGSTSI
jgi:hypothetical protein